MKKIKFLSIGVIFLSVIALGIFMGKQMFKFLEAKSLPNGPTPDVVRVKGPDSGAPGQQTLVLYSAASAAIDAPSTPEAVPSSPEPSKVVAVAEQAPAIPPEPKHLQEEWVAFATGDGINVRSGPGLKFGKVMKVSRGTGGKVLEKKDGWTRIKWTFNGKTGWVRDDLLTQGPKSVTKGVTETDTANGSAVPRARKKAVDVEALQKASKVSVAVARPAPTEKTVQGFTNGKDLPEEGTIVADPVANIRSGPGTGNARVARIPKGVVVKIQSCKLEGKYHWFKISFNKGRKEGWTR